jgi:hypothetical protein
MTEADNSVVIIYRDGKKPSGQLERFIMRTIPGMKLELARAIAWRTQDYGHSAIWIGKTDDAHKIMHSLAAGGFRVDLQPFDASAASGLEYEQHLAYVPVGSTGLGWQGILLVILSVLGVIFVGTIRTGIP